MISAVIESFSGQPYLEYMRKDVFEPIVMEETVADYSKFIIHHRTDFYILNEANQIVNAPCVDNSYKWAGGGYLGIANDLLKLGNGMMKDKYLSRDIIDML